jgi:hypothetical protein
VHDQHINAVFVGSVNAGDVEAGGMAINDEEDAVVRINSADHGRQRTDHPLEHLGPGHAIHHVGVRLGVHPAPLASPHGDGLLVLISRHPLCCLLPPALAFLALLFGTQALPLAALSVKLAFLSPIGCTPPQRPSAHLSP